MRKAATRPQVFYHVVTETGAFVAKYATRAGAERVARARATPKRPLQVEGPDGYGPFHRGRRRRRNPSGAYRRNPEPVTLALILGGGALLLYFATRRRAPTAMLPGMVPGMLGRFAFRTKTPGWPADCVEVATGRVVASTNCYAAGLKQPPLGKPPVAPPITTPPLLDIWNLPKDQPINPYPTAGLGSLGSSGLGSLGRL